MSGQYYTREEISSVQYEGRVRVCEFGLAIGSDPSKYWYEDIEGSEVFFIDDEAGSAEDKLSEYIKDTKAWYADGHEGVELEEGQWLEYHARRFTGYEGEYIDFENPFGHFSATFEDEPF